MSERPSPETDAVCENIGMGCMMVAAEFARKLERERDEARDIAGKLSMAASHCLGWHDCRLKLAEKITATLQLWHKHKEAMK